MKKFLIASGVAVLAFASLAGAQGTVFSANLTVGSTGADVVALQTALINAGYSIPSIASGAAAKGYFGSQTKTAVQAYQAAKGIPATGFVGPLTRGALNAGGSVAVGGTPVACPAGYSCTPVGGGTPVVSTGPLAGTDGNISDVSKLSQYNNEEIGDGESDVKIVGLEVEASNDGDIALKSIKLTFDGTSNVGSNKMNDYFDAVTVWQGSTKVGSADVSAFNKDSSGIYSKTITLSNAVVRADKKEKFYISVDAVSNLDSTDISGSNDAWVVDVNNIRFEDGSGVVTSETTAGDLDVSLQNVAMSFVNFSTASNTELKISTDSSSPDAGIVVVDDTDNTDDVVLLVGKIKLEGTSDVLIDQLPITLTATGATDVDAVTGSLKLIIDGEEYTETVSTSASSATVIFDNLDFTVDAGSTISFKILADINDVNGLSSDFEDGDTLTASLTSTNRDYIEAENSEGDQLSDSSEKSGTATGEAQEFRTNGITATLVSTATDATVGTSANDDVGLFTIKFKVTAIGDAVYMSSLASSYTYTVDKSGTATSSNSISGAIVNNTDTAMTSVGNYLIEEGQSETFTLSVAVPLGAGGTSGQYRTALTGIKWDTSDDVSPASTYSSELDTFKTDYKVLN